jgi:hypothetical protein
MIAQFVIPSEREDLTVGHTRQDIREIPRSEPDWPLPARLGMTAVTRSIRAFQMS